MDQALGGKRVPVLLTGGLVGFALVVGCYWLAQGSPSNGSRAWAGIGGADATGPFATGKKVFAANCARCHSAVGSNGTAAVGGPGDGLKGPDLARVGTDPQHTRQWFLDYVRDPQAENRLARMPKFEGKITVGDLLALADYLASLEKL